MNAVTMISHTGPAGSLLGTFHEAAVAFVQTWTSGYKPRRQMMHEQKESKNLDPRILADLGIEFAPEHGHG